MNKIIAILLLMFSTTSFASSYVCKTLYNPNAYSFVKGESSSSNTKSKNVIVNFTSTKDSVIVSGDGFEYTFPVLSFGLMYTDNMMLISKVASGKKLYVIATYDMNLDELVTGKEVPNQISIFADCFSTQKI